MNTRTPRLLVVEDNADDEKLILRALKRMDRDMDVEVVRDGEQAIDYLCGQQSGATLPDFMLLDWKLPKIMGAEVLRKVRSSSCCKDIPVVAFSSSDRPEDRDQCRDLGGNDYVTKPVDYARFISAVQGVVSRYLPKPFLTSPKKGKASCSPLALLVLACCCLEQLPA